ncbi:hypothetical protein SRB5_54040 [Streptomyces sp. RB5]|uniref:Endonuclease/exonuclease/phosphatase domain-containing protein n=1 Tax=Streptomyces smaragdinus TaxID=2585196 RepID=A0A7K0CP21_9ACTN|nr:endonuclease/exonuclease/phosphatase family protein [Streptomyces smaragdinus]MQY15225.1 hypothetical protein [Streptomyces smaragdinus]
MSRLLLRYLTLLAAVLTGVTLTSVPATASDLPPLRIMTYNIHHGAGLDGVVDLPRIAEVIEDSGAEVVTLQEADRHFGPRSFYADQPAELAALLHMYVVYGANLDLAPLEPGGHRRQYGTAILSRHPIRTWSNTLLPRAPGQEQRGLLTAELLIHGTPLRIATTHLTAGPATERLAQAGQVAALLAHRPATVLTGDFNATPTAPELTPLFRAFHDTWPPSMGPGYTYPTEAPTSRIDFITTTPDLRAQTPAIPRTTASDHLPVTVSLTRAPR